MPGIWGSLGPSLKEEDLEKLNNFSTNFLVEAQMKVDIAKAIGGDKAALFVHREACAKKDLKYFLKVSKELEERMAKSLNQQAEKYLLSRLAEPFSHNGIVDDLLTVEDGPHAREAGSRLLENFAALDNVFVDRGDIILIPSKLEKEHSVIRKLKSGIWAGQVVVLDGLPSNNHIYYVRLRDIMGRFQHSIDLKEMLPLVPIPGDPKVEEFFPGREPDSIIREYGMMVPSLVDDRVLISSVKDGERVEALLTWQEFYSEYVRYEAEAFDHTFLNAVRRLFKLPDVAYKRNKEMIATKVHHTKGLVFGPNH